MTRPLFGAPHTQALTMPGVPARLGFALASNVLLMAEGERAMQDAVALGIPLVTLMPRDRALRALYQARLALIRPDQHVAWRGNVWPDAGTALLQRATGHHDAT